MYIFFPPGGNSRRATNIHPPALFDSGTGRNEPTQVVKRLIGVMRENMNEEEKGEEQVEEKGKEGERERKGDEECVEEKVGKGEESMTGRKEERNVEKEGEYEEEEDLRYISQYTMVSDREDGEIRIEGENCNRVGGWEQKKKQGARRKDKAARNARTRDCTIFVSWFSN